MLCRNLALNSPRNRYRVDSRTDNITQESQEYKKYSKNIRNNHCSLLLKIVVSEKMCCASKLNFNYFSGRDGLSSFSRYEVRKVVINIALYF